MAQRRMFSPDIVESDGFLDMPVSSQSLYFHLGMSADDDGFVSPRRIMRMLGVSEDDLKILIAKRFVIPFESGVIVLTHWKVNNLVRKDWYRETRYVSEKSKLSLVNGSYSLVNENPPKSLTIRPRRLGKVRLAAKELIAGFLPGNTLTKQEAWKRYSTSYLEEKKISDPVVIEAAHQAFLNKAKAVTERAVQVFIDTQCQITPPADYFDFNKDFPKV